MLYSTLLHPRVHRVGRSVARAFRTWRPSENYLLKIRGEQLSDSDLLRIWEAYDVTGDGRMDREELAFLMEDLCEVQYVECVAVFVACASREENTLSLLARCSLHWVRESQHWGSPPGWRGISDGPTLGAVG